MEAEIGRKEKLSDTLPRHRQCARGERERVEPPPQSSQLESLRREPRMFTRVRYIHTCTHMQKRRDTEPCESEREREERAKSYVYTYMYIHRRMYVHSRVQEGRAEAWVRVTQTPIRFERQTLQAV